MPETGDWKGESKGVRSLREAVHQFGMFLQRVDHSQKISIQTAGARPRTLDVRSETKKAGQGLVILRTNERKRNPPAGGRSAPFAHRQRFVPKTLSPQGTQRVGPRRENHPL